MLRILREHYIFVLGNIRAVITFSIIVVSTNIAARSRSSITPCAIPTGKIRYSTSSPPVGPRRLRSRV